MYFMCKYSTCNLSNAKSNTYVVQVLYVQLKKYVLISILLIHFRDPLVTHKTIV